MLLREARNNRDDSHSNDYHGIDGGESSAAHNKLSTCTSSHYLMHKCQEVEY